MTWRLTGRQAFRSLRQAGSKGHSGPVTVIAAPTSANRPRVAFALGKRLGPAVTRNRVRRRLRHLMADAERRGTLVTKDYLIVGGPAISNLSFDELSTHLNNALTSAERSVQGTRRHSPG
ncbi:MULTISPECIES: ribonuclease P protein component [Candidatus Neomicrothrix]|uniref:ribonuclease P protein component n=1 Tax=Candidatus Neomicrothrix TaxID=41949 RepID=UPI000A2EFAB4|nr:MULTISPECIES: ribonuclease P protein component [Microthrix]NLH66045.1 ribonuclease P protein component [Candidatus Microthrix parvicella]MBK6503958.1 ribonuclease P protein component [Candidatus Microthrix sp.]MBK7019334.1 ribonuclease P protein component [Candidatus Microthrix sp.]MBK7320907.1 ribonuclease P protein component [Candidatus Microthrix sp.]MBL0204304.1 ribonuclease P protein component [Candidatus Microthrix sp.]